jgi:hypothetical protein
MPEDNSSEGLISRDELDRLCALFVLFEGPSDPASLAVKEAKMQFDKLVRALYDERVYPKFGDTITSVTFSGLVFLECRNRVSKKPPTSV